MKLRTIFFLILILGLSIQICFGQEPQEEENWLQEYGISQYPTLVFRYDRYSKDDLAKFREKLDLMKNAKFEDEWEGNYFDDLTELGITSFRWDSNVGFVDLYIYTCYPELRDINYGKVINTPEYVQMIPEFGENSPRKAMSVKYVKVKWSDRHYLVEESSIAAFAEKAVGIYVEPQDDENEIPQKWSRYWVSGDSEQELTGFPVFPASYKKLERFPIETKIISAGKRTIESDTEIAGSYQVGDAAVYTVTIGAGKNKGVKIGMKFDVAETKDEIYITKVNQNNAVGVILRQLNDDKSEYCFDDDSNQIECPKIKPSLIAKTRIGLWY